MLLLRRTESIAALLDRLRQTALESAYYENECAASKKCSLSIVGRPVGRETPQIAQMSFGAVSSLIEKFSSGIGSSLEVA